MRSEAVSLNADTEVTMKEIFDVSSAAPGVLTNDASVHVDGFSIDKVDAALRIIVPSTEAISAPKRDVPLVVGVPFRTRRWSNLLHFLARKFCSRLTERA